MGNGTHDCDALEARVAELERLVAAMTDEIRTRRVVVVEDDGFERVMIGQPRAMCPGIYVFGRSSEDDLVAEAPAVGVWADEWTDHQALGVSLFAHGNTVAEFGIWTTEDSPVFEPPAIWMQDASGEAAWVEPRCDKVSS